MSMCVYVLGVGGEGVTFNTLHKIYKMVHMSLSNQVYVVSNSNTSSLMFGTFSTNSKFNSTYFQDLTEILVCPSLSHCQSWPIQNYWNRANQATNVCQKASSSDTGSHRIRKL